MLLCDADVGLSNTQVHLGLAPGGGLVDVLFDKVSLAEAVVSVCGGAGSKRGFDLIAAPAGSGAFANLEAGIVERLTQKLRAAKNYDRVLIDLSAGVDARTMAFAKGADEVLLVLNSDPAALTIYGAFSGMPEAVTQRVRPLMPKESLATTAIAGIDQIMTEAVQNKFLAAPLTKEQLADLIRIQELQ